MDSLTCGICLDQLRVPVSTPCGHLCCEACLTSYIETSADAMNASCPTCRAPFTIAIPDLRFVPKKYHTLIIPSIRRVFIADASDNGAQHNLPPGSAPSPNTNRELRAQIATLTDKVNALVHDKGLLMDRCESAIRARDVHAQGERAARLEKERLDRELKDLRRKYDSVKGKYKALKASQQIAPHGPSLAPTVTTGKRKSHQAALDALLDVSLASSSAGTSAGHPYPLDFTISSATPSSREQKRPRLLGSPFDLAKRVASRTSTTSLSTRGRSRMLIDEGEEGDSGFRASDFDMELGFDFDFDPEIEGDFDLDGDVSSSGGPQRSGLPTGDVFSPRAIRGGRGSISFDFEEEEEEERRGDGNANGSLRLGNGVRPTWMLSPVDE
ncbi:transporter [Ganoderma sinense ZZ0214-1]|uniref:Transporter n=1 Tax=Ganoderma sinense ZZ0214-1 TaxID=1077348 RepID=A0A2G8RTX5_9APHY|nr:transporter [Ganoderma sinense ZZ0214-1]